MSGEARTTEITCLCGAVAVRLRGEPVLQFCCHCDDCQAVSGGAYVAVALFPADAVTLVRGETATWTYKVLPRQRCTICGGAVMAEVPGLDQIGVGAWKLPAAMVRPEFHIHCRYARAPVVDDLPHYASLPALFGGSDERAAW